MTVGRTISTRGIGQRTFKTGAQVDNIISFEIVLPDGKIINCSKNENEKIFNAARGGLGLFGIITKVKFKLEPAPEKVLVAKILFFDLQEFLNTIERLIHNEGIDAVQAHVEPSTPERIIKRMLKSGILLKKGEHTRAYILELTQYLYTSGNFESSKEKFLELIKLNEFKNTNILSSSFKEHITRAPPILDTDLEMEKPEHHHACFFHSI